MSLTPFTKPPATIWTRYIKPIVYVLLALLALSVAFFYAYTTFFLCEGSLLSGFQWLNNNFNWGLRSSELASYSTGLASVMFLTGFTMIFDSFYEVLCIQIAGIKPFEAPELEKAGPLQNVFFVLGILIPIIAAIPWAAVSGVNLIANAHVILAPFTILAAFIASNASNISYFSKWTSIIGHQLDKSFGLEKKLDPHASTAYMRYKGAKLEKYVEDQALNHTKKQAYFNNTSRGYRVKTLLVIITLTVAFLSLIGFAYAFLPGTSAFLIADGFGKLFGTSIVYSDLFMSVAPWIMAVTAFIPNWVFAEEKIGLLVGNISDHGIIRGIAMLSQKPPVYIDEESLSVAGKKDWSYTQTAAYARQKGLAIKYYSAAGFVKRLFTEPTKNLGMKLLTLLGLATVITSGLGLFMLAYPILLTWGVSITILRLAVLGVTIGFTGVCTESTVNLFRSIPSWPSTIAKETVNVWNHIIGPIFGMGDYQPVPEDIRHALNLGRNPEKLGEYSDRSDSKKLSNEDEKELLHNPFTNTDDPQKKPIEVGFDIIGMGGMGV